MKYVELPYPQAVQIYGQERLLKSIENEINGVAFEYSQLGSIDANLRGEFEAHQHRIASLDELFFLEKEIAEGKTFKIPGYLGTAISQLNDVHIKFQIPELLKEAFLRNIQFISCHAQDYPQAFFQCRWNLVDWTENPGMESLKYLLLLWKEEGEKRYPDQHWIRNTLMLINPLGGPLVSMVSVLDGTNTEDEKKVDPHRSGRTGITSLAFSPDGAYAISGYAERAF